MSYVESTLSTGERVLHWGKVSMWSQWLKIVLAGFFGLGVLGGLIGLFSAPSEVRGFALRTLIFELIIVFAFLLWVWLVYTTTELAVTNKRIVAKFGVIRRHTIELRLQKLETVQVNQSMFGRWLDYGNVVIAGAGVPQTPVPHISSPTSFSKAAMDAAQSGQADDAVMPAPVSSTQVSSPPPMAPPTKQADRANFAEVKLAKLRDEGVLSDVEFAEMKAALINRAKGLPPGA